MRKGKISVIGNGVVLDPWALVAEIEKLSDKLAELPASAQLRAKEASDALRNGLEGLNAAALAAGWSDPLRAWRRAKALNGLRGQDDFLALAGSDEVLVAGPVNPAAVPEGHFPIGLVVGLLAMPLLAGFIPCPPPKD